MMAAERTNRLVGEKSPYLLQHAHNPVDWWPWGEAALRKAREENKPIFLSIGYSSCHWCHVMERESFESEEIARGLNEHFVPIKVDREERPDIDEVYMKAVIALTGQGGWPLSVFLTPDLKPFFGGTYFPPEDRQGLPGFRRVLLSLAELWRTKREEVTRSGEEIVQAVRQMYRTVPEAGALTGFPLDAAYAALDASFDATYGGFGGAPKFPTPSNLFFLLRYFARTRRDRALRMVTKTLLEMAKGGIHDQLAGGFHRYATDRRWLVPHFEKMLYDNALLARAYVEGYQASGEATFRHTAERTLDWVLAEMTAQEGGFCAAQDADSEGGEGAFYVWRKEEILGLLGREDGQLLAEYHGVTEQGNFEHGTNVLHIARTPAELARRFGLSEVQVVERLAQAQERLLEARNQRPRPLLDDKILTSWNGLMISAFAYAAGVLDQPRYGDVASQAADFLLTKLRRDGQLQHRYRDGEAAIAGNLEDYAFVAAALLDLYEATFERRWYDEARALTEEMLQRFHDEADGGLFFSARNGELPAAVKEAYDGATPSGNSVGALTLLRLAEFASDDRLRQYAERTIRAFWAGLEANPASSTQLLCALDFFLSAPKEIVVVGEPTTPATHGLLQAVRHAWLPNKVVALQRPQDGPARSLIPVLEGKALLRGKPTVYVCERYICKLPVTSVDELNTLLAPAPVAVTS